MFKAADGQNRQVKEGGLGLEMVLHLEESLHDLSDWELETDSSPSRLKVLEMPDGFIFQLLAWARISGNQKRQHNMNRLPPWWWSLLRDKPGIQKPDHTLQRGPVRLLSTMVTSGASSLCPVTPLWPHLADFLDRGHFFFFPLAGLISFLHPRPPPLTSYHSGFVWFGLETFFPTRWTSGADQSQAKDAKFCLQAGRPFWWICIHASRSYLTLNLHDKLLERAGKVVIAHRVWRQLHFTLIGQKPSPPPLQRISTNHCVKGRKRKILLLGNRCQ